MIKFNLPQPIPFFDTPMVKGEFRLHYPDGFCYWQLLTEEGVKVLDGNAIFPVELLENDWTTSDEPLVEYLLSQAPWMPKKAPAPENVTDQGEENNI